MLINRPIISPLIHPGKGSFVWGIKNPIAKRLANAPEIATILSGNSMNTIGRISTSPNRTPAMSPNFRRDIQILLSDWGSVLARSRVFIPSRPACFLSGLLKRVLEVVVMPSVGDLDRQISRKSEELSGPGVRRDGDL